MYRSALRSETLSLSIYFSFLDALSRFHVRFFSFSFFFFGGAGRRACGALRVWG